MVELFLKLRSKMSWDRRLNRVIAFLFLFLFFVLVIDGYLYLKMGYGFNRGKNVYFSDNQVGVDGFTEGLLERRLDNGEFCDKVKIGEMLQVSRGEIMKITGLVLEVSSEDGKYIIDSGECLLNMKIAKVEAVYYLLDAEKKDNISVGDVVSLGGMELEDDGVLIVGDVWVQSEKIKDFLVI